MMRTHCQLRTLRRTIGANIHCLRKNRKITLWELSRLTGIKPEKLDQFEIGKRAIQFEHLACIASALKVGMADFLQSSASDI